MSPVMIGIILVLAILMSIACLIMFMIFAQKNRHERYAERSRKARKYILDFYAGKDPEEKPKLSKRFFIEALIEVEEQMVVDDETRQAVLNALLNDRDMLRLKKKLHAWSRSKRKMAVYHLGYLRRSKSDRWLFERFTRESSQTVRLLIVQMIIRSVDQNRMNAIMESLLESRPVYQFRLSVILGNHFDDVAPYLQAFLDREEYEIMLALVRISSFVTDVNMIQFAQDRLYWIVEEKPYDASQNKTLKSIIMKTLQNRSPERIMDHWHLSHSDPVIQRHAIFALAESPTIKAMHSLVDTMDHSGMDDVRAEAISRMVYDHKEWLDELLTRFKTLDDHRRHKLIKVFSHRIDYILVKQKYNMGDSVKDILSMMVEQDRVEPLIDFLNRNKDVSLEDAIVSMIGPVVSGSIETVEAFEHYLKERPLHKLGLEPRPHETKEKAKHPLETRKIIWTAFWIVVNLSAFPAVFMLRNAPFEGGFSLPDLFHYIVEVNYYLAIYFVIVNTIYLVLLLFAWSGSKKQVRQSKTKKYSMLFMQNLLPGISVVAPAFNEEKTIVESVNSLLNLKYPDYEVIVVNDGSRDKTLETLVNHYELQRKHPFFIQTLPTRKLRGVYVSPHIPNLIVLDKENGGKADALNLGINASKNTYVSGIDADSALEDDALLRIASSTLEDTKPFIALGGNIFPANGFTFKHGTVASKALPQKMLSRFQTIEYLRAFTSGRIGWSELRSLMIISGAFGVFRREALIETGGYLTSSGVHHKDTVGEDMELVVRLTRQALEKDRDYRVAYVYDAYCYTELPEDMKTLLKQRNRWQRGLIDILSYHRKLMLKPKYRQIGFLGYPYFFLFEFMGPFWEAQGYVMLLLAIVLGLVTPEIILAIFTASIGFGIVISLASLFMVERERLILSKKETFILVLFAFLENFGYRQLVSLHRVKSTFNALLDSGSWGAQKRKGFKTGK